MIDLIVDCSNAGIRLDVFLSKNLEKISRSAIRRRIKKGLVKLNGNECREPGKIVREGDHIEFDDSEGCGLEKIEILPEDLPLDIVYEDDDVIVVNKVRGMSVHPSDGCKNGTLVNALLFHCNLAEGSEYFRPGIVHRIDRDTTGLIVCAKSKRAMVSLKQQAFNHTMTRRYYAIVQGVFKMDFGIVDEPIGRDCVNRRRRAVNGSGSRPAITHFNVIENFVSTSYIECRLETGRTHQIRVHMAYIEHPLLGDSVYGKSRNKNPRSKGSGQFLHAGVLGFQHPLTGEQVEFKVPPHREFQKKLDALRSDALGKTRSRDK